MRISSSSLQKVPSKSSTSADSNSLQQALRRSAGLRACRRGVCRMAIRRSGPAMLLADLSSDWRCVETYAGKCVPSESARQRNPESSPAAFSSGNVVPGRSRSRSTDRERAAAWRTSNCLRVRMRRIGIGRVHAQRLQFAQQEQAEHVVDVGVGENRSGDGRLADQPFAADEVREWLRFARADREKLRAETRSARSALMATWVWVRALPWKVPARTARQLGQAQFHWGNPPPAAEPRIFTRMLGSVAAAEGSSCLGNLV